MGVGLQPAVDGIALPESQGSASLGPILYLDDSVVQVTTEPGVSSSGMAAIALSCNIGEDGF